MTKPASFLEVRVHDLACTPTLTALCAGYELGKWRASAFSEHAFNWLPEFALSEAELRELTQSNAVSMLRRAAAVIYNTDKYKKRGEFGELLLHICLREVFDTVPAISKLYYKDSPNDVVKGFDAVHVVETDTGLQLWLGEAKFYESIDKAVSEACTSIAAHAQRSFLRTEFAAILHKVDPKWKHAASMRKLLAPETSLDNVFELAVFPALLTYDSDVLASHTKVVQVFRAAFEKEVRSHHARFAKGCPNSLRVHLFLLPLNKKKDLLEALQARLEAWQRM